MNKISVNSICKVGVLLISVSPVFLHLFLGRDEIVYVLTSFILLVITIISLIFYKDIFSTVFFFLMVFIMTPINDKFMRVTGFSFAGAYFLLPIVSYLAFALLFPSLRKTLSWWRKDTINFASWVIILGLSTISAISLYLWANYFQDSLTEFIKQLPIGKWYIIFANGVAFAAINASIEEFLSRGMLWNGLEKVFNSKYVIILTQSLFFGILHYSGFPNGATGVVMVFLWSLVLGIIRYRTNGLAGVIISHFFSDLAIYFLLYSFK